ncbi:MAG: adenosylcobinamide-GDP ribazoletransferase [Thermoguttaceae bacterium]|nr:adenosylcobinamide-GDP ribazoletransferase [Thermoguttaceae bacterium]
MTWIRSLIVAFSLYSRIPMPQFEWREGDLKHNLVFLPWVGAVVGALVYASMAFFERVSIPLVAQVAIVSAIPLIVTGGFHVDGFMDVQDALRSYKSREEKLEILKDPRVGAFSVICLLTYSLVWTASLAIALEDDPQIVAPIFALSFFVVRALSGALALTLRRARNDGALAMETRDAGNVDLWLLACQATLGAATMIWLDAVSGVACVLALALFTARYRRLCYREFGGVTGDTAGYYVTVGENVVLTTLAIARALQ